MANGKHSEKNLKKYRINFLSANYNVGTTTTGDRKKNRDKFRLPSFGCPRYFFRFSFTSGLIDIPMACVDWCKVTVNEFQRHYFRGFMTLTEWEEGPKLREGISPFVALDFVVPSRFMLAFDNRVRMSRMILHL